MEKFILDNLPDIREVAIQDAKEYVVIPVDNIVEDGLHKAIKRYAGVYAMEIEADLQSRIPILIKQYTKTGLDPKEAQKRIKLVNQADPTGNKATYTQWLVNLDIKKAASFPEDNEKLKQALKEFEKAKKSKKYPYEKDIMKYPTYGDLREKLDSLGEEESTSKRELKKQRDFC